jgi:hypothetical protein
MARWMGRLATLNFVVFGCSGALAVDFNRDIRPLLSDTCFTCHGNDAATREADLRLDLRESAEHVLSPGDPDHSDLVNRISQADPDLRMPPESTGKTLTTEQIELIKQWIKEGAKYESHWAFEPLSEVEVPAREGWGNNEIDHFTHAAMRAHQLSPASEADKVTLIRRVTFDLTGLPPTLDEVEKFLADDSPEAYEKLVDRLHASPHYGEHKARFWLDAVRYGDTHGLHLDNYREMFPYRDWVIKALNDNMPFDQFATEQLAGDLLENAQLSQLVASGYNRCNITTNEGGSIPEEVYVRNVVDRVNTFGTVFLGLTVGCAQCHDHKYDPLSQREYFEMWAFFNNIDGNEMDGNVKDHAPSVHVPSEADQQTIAEHKSNIASLDAEIAERVAQLKPQFDRWVNEQESSPRNMVAELPADEESQLVAYFPLDDQGDVAFDAASKRKMGSVKGTDGWGEGRVGGGFAFPDGHYIELDRKVGAFGARDAFSYGGWIRTPGNVTGAAIARMDESNNHRGYDLWIEQRRVAAHLIGSWPQYAIKVITKSDVLKPDEWHHVFVTYSGNARANGVRLYVDGVPQEVDIQVDSLNAKGRPNISTNVPMRLGRRYVGSPFANGQIDDVKLYKRELEPAEVKQAWQRPLVDQILAIVADRRTDEQMQLLLDYYVARQDSEISRLANRKEELRNEITKIENQAPTTLVFRERRKVRPAFLLNRGQYDDRGEQVERATPRVLPPLPEGAPRDRLGLAQWVTSPEHPLMSRVTVNRIWQQYFGTGLVRTAEDFGLQGEAPSHPELLDWLASEFIRSGWDTKALHKMIVMSATYRQTSKVGIEAYRKDPENRWLSHGPRFRLDAEMLRDQALALSGLLVDKQGGPSVKPPQPEGLWEAVGYSGSNTAHFTPDSGENVFRRSVYIYWKRTSPPPYLTICDAPSREESIVRRERTNTPLAALLMMNEVQYMQSAIELAVRMNDTHVDQPRAKAQELFRRVTFRVPTPGELDVLVAAYEDFAAKYKAAPDEAKQLLSQAASSPQADTDMTELAAWGMVANTILNLDEVVVKN